MEMNDMAWKDKARKGNEWYAWYGMAYQGKAWHDKEREGMEWQGMTRNGKERHGKD
jgi:hypothetical protein